MPAASFADLGPHEQELSAASGQEASGRFTDPVDERIMWLVSRCLTPIAIAEGGWVQLYRDPRDGRYWELTFPQGSLHGGGPRRLTLMSAAQARERYPSLSTS